MLDSSVIVLPSDVVHHRSNWYKVAMALGCCVLLIMLVTQVSGFTPSFLLRSTPLVMGRSTLSSTPAHLPKVPAPLDRTSAQEHEAFEHHDVAGQIMMDSPTTEHDFPAPPKTHQPLAMLFKALDPTLRVILVIAAVAISCHAWKQHREQEHWSMAVIDDHIGLPHPTVKSTLQNLEGLLEVEEQQPAVAIKRTTPVEVDQLIQPNSSRHTAAQRPSSTLARDDYIWVQTVDAGILAIHERRRRIPKVDVLKMKAEVFANSGFQLLLAEDAMEFGRTGFIGGHLFRGRMRGNTSDIVQEVQCRMRQAFGNKYELLVIPEPPLYDDFMTQTAENNSKPAFMLLPSSEVREDRVASVHRSLTALLIFFTLATTVLIAFEAGVTDLTPAESDVFFNVAGSQERMAEVIQGHWRTVLSASFTVGISVLASTFAHELARRITAARNGVHLSLPLFLPNMEIGTLGAATKVHGMAPNKAALFDIAASGPIAGGIVALLCFIAGLIFTASATPNDASLITLPSTILHSSLLLGGVLKALFGDVAVQCHPLVFGGWCGLMATALSTLPLGTTDGGRIMQTIVGRQKKETASLLVLLCLAFDALAPGLGLSWGLAAVFLSGGSERNIRDQFTPLDPVRRNLGIAMIVLPILLLIPSPGIVG